VPSYRVSQRAKEDLRQIGLYTQREWGKVQRRKYLSGLDNKFSALSDNPLITPERQEFFPVVRIHQHESHLIIYVLDDLGITILRVLHQSADIDSHL